MGKQIIIEGWKTALFYMEGKMNIEAITEAITEATAEALRDYEIITSIDGIRADAAGIISKIMEG